MNIDTFKIIEVDDPLDYYGEYPYKGYRSASEATRLSKRLIQRPSLNPKVIWKHLRYSDL